MSPGAPESNRICRSHVPELQGEKKMSESLFLQPDRTGEEAVPSFLAFLAGKTKSEKKEPLEIKTISG